jgi:hypothetical protein
MRNRKLPISNHHGLLSTDRDPFQRMSPSLREWRNPAARQREENADFGWEFVISQNPDFAFLWTPRQPFARCRTAEMRIVDEMPVIQAELFSDG